MKKLDPKQLYGPSSLGGAQARALRKVGGTYQWSQRDTNTVVKQQGDFSKVLVAGIEYTSSGRVSPTVFRSVETPRYIVPYRPTVARASAINMGDGKYLGAFLDAPLSLNSVFTPYPIPPVGTYNYVGEEWRATSGITARTYYGSDLFLGGIQTLQTNSGAPGAGTYLISQLVDPIFSHEVLTPVPNKIALIPFTYDGGRTDSQGRKLADLAISQWPRDSGDPISTGILASAFTRANAEFISFIPSFSVPGASGFLVAEQFFFPGEEPEDLADVTPKLWMFVLNGNDIGDLSVFNLTTQLFGGARLPQSEEVSGFPGRYFFPHSGDVYNTHMGFVMSQMRVVTIPGALIIAYALNGNIGAENGWRLRIARLVFSGSSVSATITFDDFSGASGGTAGALFGRYIQDIVHLGEGWLLARRVYGFGGINFQVDFLLSTDGGESWSPFDPSGFSAPLQNQYFGDFIVHKSREAGQHGVVLINAWDTNSLAYYTYESKNSGASWQRRGLVAKPQSFYRVDSMTAGDGGGNFRLLRPGPDPTRPVDVTMPDRYGP